MRSLVSKKISSLGTFNPCLHLKFEQHIKNSSMANKIDWVVLIPDKEGTSDKRPALAEEHIKMMNKPIESGIWKSGAGILSAIPAEGQPKEFNGSILFAHAATKEEVLDSLKKDPFMTGGVWNLDKTTIQPISIAFGPDGPTKVYT
ncbi:hypothetical protein F5883DRAFT_509593 [Diaporthe sp. PMI_573]|nr:hypothetical protein F5883DRAFT_509593 [Diaporthaceae sp. PMI_573]